MAVMENILQQLRALNIDITSENGNVVLRGKKAVLPADLKEAVRAHKSELIAHLATQKKIEILEVKEPPVPEPASLPPLAECCITCAKPLASNEDFAYGDDGAGNYRLECSVCRATDRVRQAFKARPVPEEEESPQQFRAADRTGWEQLSFPAFPQASVTRVPPAKPKTAPISAGNRSLDQEKFARLRAVKPEAAELVQVFQRSRSSLIYREKLLGPTMLPRQLADDLLAGGQVAEEAVNWMRERMPLMTSAPPAPRRAIETKTLLTEDTALVRSCHGAPPEAGAYIDGLRQRFAAYAAGEAIVGVLWNAPNYGPGRPIPLAKERAVEYAQNVLTSGDYREAIEAMCRSLQETPRFV